MKNLITHGASEASGVRNFWHLLFGNFWQKFTVDCERWRTSEVTEKEK